MLKHVDVIVITKGAEGAIIYAEGNEVVIPVVPEDRIIDPTGVGDAFRGGFLAAYAHGWDWTICGQIGSLAAVYVLEQNGTRTIITRARNLWNDSANIMTMVVNWTHC